MLGLLVLIIPASNIPLASNQQSLALDSEANWQVSHRPPQSGAASELNFIVGDWDVFDAEGRIGISEFHFEKSGRMLHEDWIAKDGATSQGVTYFDAASQMWKMTFAGSDGSIVEVRGRMNSGSVPANLSLVGTTTTKEGRVRPIKVMFAFTSTDEFWVRCSDPRSPESDGWGLKYVRRSA